VNKYRRVSLDLEEPVYNKLRRLQAKRIKKNKQGCSFSKVIELVLVHGLKKKKVVTLKK